MEHDQSLPGKYILLRASTRAGSRGSWPRAACLGRPGSARATYASALMSNTVLTQIRCCGRAYGACRNGAGMARNRGSKIAYFEYFSIYMEKNVKICRNMQQKYAIICKNMDSFCINMQLYVKNMQKYASKICVYMQNMHFICIYM